MIRTEPIFKLRKEGCHIFCTQCGNRTNENVRFCVSCGAELQQEAVPTPATTQAPAPAMHLNTAGNKQRKNGMRVLLLFISIILILMGTGYLGLTVAGKTAKAHVTGYEQQLYLHNDDSTRDSRRYKVEYEFTVNGERYTGSVTRIFEGGSHTRQTIPIRYLLFWPHINAEDSDGSVVAGLLMVGLGVILLVVELKVKGRSRRAQ